MVHQANRLGYRLQIQRIAFVARQITRVQGYVEFREKSGRGMRETGHDAREQRSARQRSRHSVRVDGMENNCFIRIIT